MGHGWDLQAAEHLPLRSAVELVELVGMAQLVELVQLEWVAKLEH